MEDQENLPYNLYPFVHLLPSGNLFVFAGQLSIVLDYNGNKVMIRLGGEVMRGDDTGSEDGCSLQFVIHSFGSHGVEFKIELQREFKVDLHFVFCCKTTKASALFSSFRSPPPPSLPPSIRLPPLLPSHRL